MLSFVLHFAQERPSATLLQLRRQPLTDCRCAHSPRATSAGGLFGSTNAPLITAVSLANLEITVEVKNTFNIRGTNRVQRIRSMQHTDRCIMIPSSCGPPRCSLAS